MFFANYGFLLWLAPLVALPAAIHLLNRKFPQAFQFSSIAQIKKTLAQRSRLFRWRHIILAILRTLALVLLLLAFLKPIREMFGSSQTQQGPRNVVILLDHSLSMEARVASLSGRDRAVIEAARIIDTLGPNDLLNIRAVGRNAPPCFTEPSTHHADAVSYLKTLEPGLAAADFNKANAAVLQGFAGVKGRPEIYYISDFQRTTWAEVDFSRIPAAVRMFFVNIAPEVRANHAIVGARLVEPTVLSGESAPVEVSIGNYSESPFTGDIEVIVDATRSVKTDAQAAPWSVSKVTVPVSLGPPGTHTLEVVTAADELPQDDRYFLATRVADKEEVLIVSDETGGKQQTAAFFLNKAINPYERLAGSLLPKSVSSQGLTEIELATTKKVFLTSLDRLAEPTCKLLAQFLQNGGSIVWFLDGKFDPANLEALDQAGGGGMAPLALAQKQGADNLAGGAQQLIRGDFQSKYLRLFRGSQRQNLALVEFYEFYHARPTGHGRVLLTYADGSPAMATAASGLGTLLVCNFSVNELASNMARQRVFPAWIHDLVKTLDTDQPPERPLEIGDEIHTEVWQAELTHNAVKAPDGRSIRTDRQLDGSRYHVSFAGAQQGIYQLAETDALHAFAVNLPPAESDLRPVDLDLLPRRFEESQQGSFVEGREDFEALVSGRPLYHWFVLGMVALLFAELGSIMSFRRLAR